MTFRTLIAFNSIIFILLILLIEVFSHGMVLNPVARGSRWRYNSSAPHNYNDAEQYCGGRSIQWNQNDGKCGICGDNFADPRPRKHEIGGEFGEPVIVGRYDKESLLTTKVHVTANHKGKFWFELCHMEKEQQEEENCFNKILLTKEGEKYWWLTSNESNVFEIDLRLPDMTCSHCIFRWTWMTGELPFYKIKFCPFKIFTGNSWGDCENGTSATGCGNQEHFRTCSDIAIF